MCFFKEIAILVDFASPTHDVDVVRCEYEFVGLGEVARCESKHNREDGAEPEIGRLEYVVVVSVNWGGEPPRLDDRIDSLDIVRAGNIRKHGSLTVYSQTRIMPMETAKNTQAVQTLVFNPLNKLAVMTAEIAIVYDMTDISNQANKQRAHAYRSELVLGNIVTVRTSRGHMVRV